ncbi:ankyrin repeat-containing domain protein [Xylariaceae sp. FL0255]|nr:ankyrin repeat-containing domain protein [Xylariaceae sp. FL0255]
MYCVDFPCSYISDKIPKRNYCRFLKYTARYLAVDRMSLVLSSLGPKPDEQLQKAVSQFCTALTPEQHQELLGIRTIPDADSIMTFTAELDARNRSRRGHSVGSRVFTVLRSVRDFCAIADVYVSSNPQIAALVWGSVRLTMHIILAHTSYYEAVCGLMMQIGNYCPVLDEYVLLYKESKQLQRSVSDFHACIIRCCHHILEAMSRGWVTQVLQAFYMSFDREFQPDKEELRQYGERVKASIALAKAKDDARRLTSMQERSDENGNLIKIFASKSDDHRQEQRSLWIRQAEREAQERKKRILDSLCVYNTERLFKQNQRKRFGSTASWIFRHPAFLQWKDAAGPPVLCCSGKIGSGKSVLASSVIDHFYIEKDDFKFHISYYFAQFSEPRSLKACAILKSILRQRLPGPLELSDEMEKKLVALSEESSDDPLLSSAVSWDHRELYRIAMLLSNIIDTSIPFYIVIDGLDECERSQRLTLFKALSQLLKKAVNVRLFLCCGTGLLEDTEKHFPSYRNIPMDLGTQEDISVYIDGMIQEKIDLGELQDLHPKIIDEIKTALNCGADGMFLWVYFQIIEICRQTCDEDIRHTLTDLPDDLEQTYRRLLQRIVCRKDKIPQKVFPWVAASVRPLTRAELREAIAIRIGQQHTEPERLCNDVHSVTSTSENLLHIDEEDQSVRFTHHTIKQFLLKRSLDPDTEKFSVDLSDADHYIGEICVTYLHFNDFKTTVSRYQKKIQTSPDAVVKGMDRKLQKLVAIRQAFRSGHRSYSHEISHLKLAQETDEAMMSHEKFGAHPFLSYAGTNWMYHTKTFHPEKTQTYSLWELILCQGSDIAKAPVPEERWGKKNPLLWEWALKNEHLALLNYGIQNEWAPVHGAPCPMKGMTALQTASFGGYTSIVKTLLHAKADVNAKGTESGYTALQAAALNGHHDIVEILLREGALIYDPRAETSFHCALQAAAWGGHLSIVELLIDAGAEVNAQAPKTGYMALQAASLNGHCLVVETLLKHGADVDAAESYEDTALQLAAKNCHHDIVRVLLSAGACRSFRKTGQIGNHLPIHLAAIEGQPGVVSLLARLKADLNFISPYNDSTALQLAALYGHEKVVDELLKKGANVNARGKEGCCTALQAAAFTGNMSIVEKLLEAGADVNAPAVKGFLQFTALQAAAQNSHNAVLRKLIDADADVNAVTCMKTALDYAIPCAKKTTIALIERNGGKCAEYNAELGCWQVKEDKEPAT